MSHDFHKAELDAACDRIGVDPARVGQAQKALSSTGLVVLVDQALAAAPNRHDIFPGATDHPDRADEILAAARERWRPLQAAADAARAILRTAHAHVGLPIPAELADPAPPAKAAGKPA